MGPVLEGCRASIRRGRGQYPGLRGVLVHPVDGVNHDLRKEFPRYEVECLEVSEAGFGELLGGGRI